MKRCQRFLAAGVLLAAAMFSTNCPVAAQILRIGEMNTQQIRALNLQKTVVLIPGGILEEHGPFLPSYADGYADEAYTRALAKAIVARPGWTVVLFPQISLGNDPANTIGGKTVFPGSYPVRMAKRCGRSTWILPMSSETRVSDGYSSFTITARQTITRRSTRPRTISTMSMAAPWCICLGSKPVFLCCGSKEKVLSAKQLAEEGFSVHAGADEQSQLLFLRPEFVPAGYLSAPSLTGTNFADLVRIAKAEGWPGYFGAPRLATAAMGAQEFALSSQNVNAMALKILDGLDYRKIPRYADEMDPLDVAGENAELQHERAVEQWELDWLKTNKIQ